MVQAAQAGEKKTASADRIAQEIDHWIDDLDLRYLWQKVEDLARQRPAALALAAFTVGLAAGALARKSPRASAHPGSHPSE